MPIVEEFQHSNDSNMIELCAQLGNKLNTVEGELRFVSSQLSLIQAFLQNKFHGEFEEFVEATEQTDVSCSNNDKSEVPPETPGPSSSPPKLADNEETYGLHRNEQTNSSTKNPVVLSPERVHSVRPISSLASQLPLSSPISSVFTCTRNSESYFFPAEVEENVELQDLLFWIPPEKEVNEEGEDSFVDVETVQDTHIKTVQAEELATIVEQSHSEVDLVGDGNSLDPQLSTADTNSPSGETIDSQSSSSIGRWRIQKKKQLEKERKRTQRFCLKKVRIPVKRLSDTIQRRQETPKRDAGKSQRPESSLENAVSGKSDDEDLSTSDSQSTESDWKRTGGKSPVLPTQKTKRGGKKEVTRRKLLNEKPLSCYRCSKTFRYASALRSHERNDKIHRVKRYTCPICLKRFCWASRLQKHEEIHRYE